ncbi:hypothetical protein SAMN04487998_2773 [Hymenobacter actinosclerus]|uniref:Uncharacterized protein n=2 Tax=Hymenobacter actinosclerus TaxID=82805 RepID=A0A1I0H8Y7_9BACT|nr:hypothetical protein SAMN04487998_2773 [Hymenobacter actinosclerus]
MLTSSFVAAAQAPSKQFYELADGILGGLQSQAVSRLEKGDDGYYHWRNAPTDISTVRLLLLNHAYSDSHVSEGFISAKQGTEEYSILRKYFSERDIASFRQQLPAAHSFMFDQAYIKYDWVHVINQDTIRAIDGRTSKKGQIVSLDPRGDYLSTHYGNWQLFSISGMLFSEDGKRAMVEVGYGTSMDVWIYEKIKGQWRKKVAIYSMVE